MNLVDLVKIIDSVDEEYIIFQENNDDYGSDIILSSIEDRKVLEEGKIYYYLIEVFLAKEFINDWIASLNFKPTVNEIAKRLHDYAINDA
jgi:hypothetical protein